MADREEGLEKHLTRRSFALWTKLHMPAVVHALRAMLAGSGGGDGTGGADPLASAKLPQTVMPQVQGPPSGLVRLLPGQMRMCATGAILLAISLVLIHSIGLACAIFGCLQAVAQVAS